MSEQTAADTQAAPDTGAADAPATEATQAPDTTALMARMDELAQSVSALQPQQPTDDRGLADLSSQPFDPYANTGIDPNAEDDDGEYGYDQQQGPDIAQLQDFIAQQVQQAAAPMLSQLSSQQIRQEAIALEGKYPDLAKPEVAGQIVKAAEQFAQNLGFANNFSPDQVAKLAHSPALIEQMYLAQRASQQAQQETPADATSSVQLEGTAAQVETQEDDLFDQMVNVKPPQEGFKWT